MGVVFAMICALDAEMELDRIEENVPLSMIKHSQEPNPAPLRIRVVPDSFVGTGTTLAGAINPWDDSTSSLPTRPTTDVLWLLREY